MMMMFAQAFAPSFLVPGLAAAGAAAVAVPILIHILSRRPRRPEPWAAMRFLLAAYRRHRTRTRLEQMLLLATRCLLVLLIGLALAGPAWSALASLATGGRTVVIVLDNSLTTNATGPDGGRRFNRLRGTARRLLEELEPGDRAALITAARPAEPIVVPPSADPAAVRRQVELIQPSPAAADLTGALELAQRTLEEAEDAGRSAWVALISDFSAGAVPDNTTLPQKLSGLSERARLLLLEPAPTVQNVQIAELTPDRRLIVPDVAGATPTVAWTVRLRRHAAEAASEGLTTVRLKVPDATPVRRTVRWEAGQREATLRIDTPMSQEGLLPVEASLEPGEVGTDALAPDNARIALVRVRQELGVLLVGRADGNGNEARFSPQRWMRTVLAPVSDELGWPIEVTREDAEALRPPMLRRADAAFVLRGDLLSETGWDALRDWTLGGGLAWFMPPAEKTPTLWPQKLTDVFGLPWNVTLEPEQHEPSLELSTDPPDAAELERLRADLPDLLRPVEVYHRLPIDPASLGSETDTLLRGENGEPLLIAATVAGGSRGRVMMQAMAVDTEWTNLPAKPLFVPLVHEVLRAAIDRLQPQRAFEPGDQPLLGPAWANASRLTGPEDEELLLVDPDEADDSSDQNTTEGDGGDDGEASGSSSASAGDTESDKEDDPSQGAKMVRPVRAFGQPGLYRTETETLAVNVRAEAADTRAAGERTLRTWLRPLGDWTTIQADAPAAPMHSSAERADLGWPLLWIVLGLALLEMLLARWVSHAGTGRRSRDVVSVASRRAA